jgi:putative spermidine/putrescine transport system substrate-binding protein
MPCCNQSIAVYDKKGEIRMNKILNKILLATAVATVSVTMAQAEVNMASWGGAYTESQQKAYADTWDAGIVNFIEYNGGLDEVRSQVASGIVTWDIVDVFPDQARIGCGEGLFEKLDRTIFTPATDGTSMDNDIMVEPPNDCVVPNIFWSYMAFYEDGEFIGDQPSTIADFFDVEKFPGKRGIHTWPNALIEMALYADGVMIEDLYDVMSTSGGIDRAFSKLDTIKGHVVFWSSGTKPLELVKSGEVAKALAYNGRVGAAILDDGEKFVPI